MFPPFFLLVGTAVVDCLIGPYRFGPGPRPALKLEAPEDRHAQTRPAAFAVEDRFNSLGKARSFHFRKDTGSPVTAIGKQEKNLAATRVVPFQPFRGHGCCGFRRDRWSDLGHISDLRPHMRGRVIGRDGYDLV